MNKVVSNFSTVPSPVATCQAMFAAQNACGSLPDKAAFTSLFGPNYLSLQPTDPSQDFVGKNIVEVHWTVIFQLIADLQVSTTPFVGVGSLVLTRQLWSGHNSLTAPSAGAYGTPDPNSPYNVPVDVAFHVTDGLIDAGWVDFPTPGRPGQPNIPAGYQLPVPVTPPPQNPPTVTQAREALQDSRSPAAANDMQALLQALQAVDTDVLAPTLKRDATIYQPVGISDSGSDQPSNVIMNKRRARRLLSDVIVRGRPTRFATMPRLAVIPVSPR